MSRRRCLIMYLFDVLGFQITDVCRCRQLILTYEWRMTTHNKGEKNFSMSPADMLMKANRITTRTRALPRWYPRILTKANSVPWFLDQGLPWVYKWTYQPTQHLCCHYILWFRDDLIETRSEHKLHLFDRSKPFQGSNDILSSR